ncbi:unnamed protein product [Timema podura]|uniref:Uncharacterized protein n=1 Tax=Timema podura TaxID=61482 RepID=A0ABN7NPX3_TIMPD|nr:unnamed protein product [Timema podura]
MSEVILKVDGICVVSEVTPIEDNWTNDNTIDSNLKSEWPVIWTAAIWHEKKNLSIDCIEVMPGATSPLSISTIVLSSNLATVKSVTGRSTTNLNIISISHNHVLLNTLLHVCGFQDIDISGEVEG